jgi:hypothetical protein
MMYDATKDIVTSKVERATALFHRDGFVAVRDALVGAGLARMQARFSAAPHEAFGVACSGPPSHKRLAFPNQAPGMVSRKL